MKLVRGLAGVYLEDPDLLRVPFDGDGVQREHARFQSYGGLYAFAQVRLILLDLMRVDFNFRDTRDLVLAGLCLATSPGVCHRAEEQQASE